MTISPWPSRVASPARIIGAGTTLATLPTVTGTPLRSSMTIAAMSSTLRAWLTPRMYRASPLWTRYPPPTLALFDLSASNTSVIVSLWMASSSGSTWTS